MRLHIEKKTEERKILGPELRERRRERESANKKKYEEKVQEER